MPMHGWGGAQGISSVLDGQDVAGIVVLHQIVPGFDKLTHSAPIAGGEADPAFFNYVLAACCITFPS